MGLTKTIEMGVMLFIGVIALKAFGGVQGITDIFGGIGGFLGDLGGGGNGGGGGPSVPMIPAPTVPIYEVPEGYLGPIPLEPGTYVETDDPFPGPSPIIEPAQAPDIPGIGTGEGFIDLITFGAFREPAAPLPLPVEPMPSDPDYIQIPEMEPDPGHPGTQPGGGIGGR